MRIRSILLTLFVLSGSGAAVAQGEQAKPKATVRIVPAVDAVAPGASFDVGVQFEIADHWHIYWQNPGDGGIAPKVTWTLPPGFTVNELQFPVPKRHVDPSGTITTNVLEGSPVLIATLTPPATLTGKQSVIKARVTYLVCRESCLQEKAELELKLPIRRSAAEVQAGNVELFDLARRALPKGQSKYLTLTPALAFHDPSTNRSLELLLNVNIGKGFHIQSHTPSNAAFIKSDVFLKRTEGVSFRQTQYPEPVLREDKVFGNLSEYVGNIVLRTTGRIEGDTPPDPRPPIAGIFVYQACNDRGMCFPPEALAFSLNDSAQTSAAGATTAAPGPMTIAPSPAAPSERSEVADVASEIPLTLLGVLWWAFLGGLILNVMPCVLPVMSIKILSFVQQAREAPSRVFHLGLAFSAGILVSFLVLAAVIIALKSAAHDLGWGFQFQSPTFVILMMSVMFVFGLSLLGVFTISLPGTATTRLSAAEAREGYLGAFLKGVLGTVLATPCTAPFLGPALGVAFTRSSNSELLLIFATVGLGMASPFILLTWQPAWLRYLPRPGPWMEHFEQLMGFVLLGTVVWLMSTLGEQIGARGLVATVAFLCFLGLAVWILGMQTPLTPLPRRMAAWAGALIIVAGGWWGSFSRGGSIQGLVVQLRQDREYFCGNVDLRQIPPGSWDHGNIPWQPWSKGLAEKLAADGYTVYLDYTATWCATCIANKKATLESDLVRARMKENCVVPLKADFTLEDPDILAELQRFNRSGVPLNVIYPAGKPEAPIVMPEQLVGRASLVVEKLNDAGPSIVCNHTARPDDRQASR